MKKFFKYIVLVSSWVLLLTGCSVAGNTTPGPSSTGVPSQSPIQPLSSESIIPCTSPFQSISPTAAKYKIELTATLGATPNVEFELAKSFSDLPDKAPVYKMIHPDVTVAYVKELGAKFGISGEIKRGTWGYGMHDVSSNATLEVYTATGTFEYSKDDSLLYPKQPPVLPSDEDAKKIAMNFLISKGLLPEGDIAYKVQAGTFNGIPEHLLVSFKHVVELAGPGSKHGVRIGKGGEVIQVFINPTNPLKLPVEETVALKPFNQAFQEMKVAKRYWWGVPFEAKKVIIDSVTVAWWQGILDERQDYIAPVYVFKGRCLDESGKQMYIDRQTEEKFTSYLEAIQ